MPRLHAVVVSLVSLCSLSLVAQTPDTAVLNGSVVDSTRAFVAGAHIAATNELTRMVRTTETDASGHFVLLGLPVAGLYEVVISKEGFADARVQHVGFTGGNSAKLVLTLSVTRTNSTVEVQGAADDLRVDQPQSGIRLSQMQMEETPLSSRRITYLPLLSAANRPAINQGDIFMNENLFTTNGAGRRQAWFEVDGSNSVDMWGRQTIFSNIPLMAVDQMAVLTNAFSAEYGGSTGSVVNIITRSGGSQLHGQLLELWRPAVAEASLAGFTSGNATSGNELTSDVLGQTAAQLSGALDSMKRTHFFLASEWNREAKASPVTSLLAPGSFVGHYRGWLGFLRLDRQINENNNAFMKLNFDSFTDTNPNGIVGGNSLPNVARTFHRRTYSGELGETAVLSPRLVNNARVQFQLASPITGFDPVVYGTQFVVPISSSCGNLACGTFTSGTSQSALLMNRQYQGSNTLAFTHGRHQVMAGGSVIYARNGGNSKEFGGPIFLGKFTYNTCSFAAAICESATYLNNINNVASYQQSYGNASYIVDDLFWALFAQDDLRVNNRLTFNAGLRYERQMLTDAKMNFAPRVGFVFDTRGNGETVVRGGFGIYYSQIVDNAAASYALGEPAGVFTYTAATPGQVGFPGSIAAAPLQAFPSGAVAPVRSLYVRPGQPGYLSKFFPTSVLNGYPNALLNPYSEQWTFSVEQRLPNKWILGMDYVGTHTLRVIRPLDVDGPAPFIRTAQNQTRSAQAANCTRPYWIYWYSQHGTTCSATTASNSQPAYGVIQTDVNNGFLHYDALDVNLSHSFSHNFQVLASYTWSHTMDNVDPDTTSQNPNDTNFTGHQEYGNAIYDQRNRFVLSGVYVAPLKINIGGIATLANGLPYNLVTGITNSGNTGATTDRPVINGVVVGRNTGRGKNLYSVDPFVSRMFPIYHELVKLDLRAEAFNVLNHSNFVGFNGTYGNGATAPSSLGTPLPGVTSQLPARFMQFSARMSF
jgi:Carboxypeptidase regulatory-like domain/TonB dependent receptor